MYHPSPERFCELAKEGNMIPVFREQLADAETPVTVLARFHDDQYAFLLESVDGGEKWGRYSYVGIHPERVFKVEEGQAKLLGPQGEQAIDEEGIPFFNLRKLLGAVKPVNVPGLPPFSGGAVGYLGYETVNEFEKLPEPKKTIGSPTCCMMLADDLVVFDNVQHTLKMVACAHLERFDTPMQAYEDACRRIDRMQERLSQPPVAGAIEPLETVECDEVKTQPNMQKHDYERMVEKTKAYIEQGDIIQAVLSQRFDTELEVSPLTLYRALRYINPSPYMYYFKFKDQHIVGSSPEIMVKKTARQVEVRPIAGTRPRGETVQRDRELADELLNDEKERAEHLMLVDLGRNDLGRIAVGGSVQVPDFMTIERYSHVMHIVSHVQAQSRENVDSFDVVKATFPAGTLSGAPKIRAMEIINELEPEPRGMYGGAVGFIGYDDDMDLAITIRTMTISNGVASVQAGAGLVADSVPETEYQETVNKASGMLQAVRLAARGLRIA